MGEEGQTDLAEAIRGLSQAIVDAPDLVDGQRQETVEHLTFLAKQAAPPVEQRQRASGARCRGLFFTGAVMYLAVLVLVVLRPAKPSLWL